MDTKHSLVDAVCMHGEEVVADCELVGTEAVATGDGRLMFSLSVRYTGPGFTFQCHSYL